MADNVSNKEILRAEQANSFWIKIAGGVLTAGIIAMVSMSYKTTTQIAVMQTDVTYVRETLKSFDTRLTRLENSTFTGKDAEQLKTWTELKLEALKVQIQSNKTELENIRRNANDK